MEIRRDRITNKETYVSKIFGRFPLNGAKEVSLPLASHFKLSVDQCPKSEEEKIRLNKFPYANVVDSAMYSLQ